jgi:hypothetical protein
LLDCGGYGLPRHKSSSARAEDTKARYTTVVNGAPHGMVTI